MQKISIFGATGSIGQSTIDLIRRDLSSYDVVALTGGRNIARLAADAIELGADLAVTAYEEALPELRQALAGSRVEASAGQAALIEAAARPADLAGADASPRRPPAVLPGDPCCRAARARPGRGDGGDPARGLGRGA